MSGSDPTAPETENGEAKPAGSVPAVRWVFPDDTAPLAGLTAEEVVLGRDVTCDAHLPGGEVSRRHAVLRRVGTRLEVRDLDSRNGVFVNGTRVQTASLSPGDVLRLGEWVGVVVKAEPGPASRSTFGEDAPGLFVGPTLGGVLAPLRAAATTDLPIVIEGETGTGKERVAHAVHHWSGRSGPFVAVNCAALPEALAEAQLFGYRRGAFTGADRPAEGFFRAAHGGTLLLDEVLDLPLPIQAKLLRAIETREVIPLGEAVAVPAQVRVIAAAQGPLGEAVRNGRFRPDLLARLDGLTVTLPPLRERRDEIRALFLHFAAAHGGRPGWPMSPRFLERLCAYDWPLNVRELDHLVRRLIALHGNEPRLRRSHLPAHIGPAATRDEPEAPAVSDGPSLAALLEAMRKHQGNVARAAAELGISRQRVYRLMNQDDLSAVRSLRDRARTRDSSEDRSEPS